MADNYDFCFLSVCIVLTFGVSLVASTADVSPSSYPTDRSKAVPLLQLFFVCAGVGFIERTFLRRNLTCNENMLFFHL